MNSVSRTFTAVGRSTNSVRPEETSINRMTTILRWTGPVADLRTLHDAYVGRCRTALEDFIRTLGYHDPARANGLRLEVDGADDVKLQRVMLAPQTAYYLFAARPLTHASATVADYLTSSFTVEHANAGGRTSVLETTWSALGDCALEPSGAMKTPTKAPVPLDTGSPYAIGGDLGAQYESPLTCLDSDETALAAYRFNVAAEKISITSLTAYELVTTFIKVLALRTAKPEKMYSHGSDQQHPGRAVITNWQELDTAKTAEALVHEAIHALLYTTLEVVPWGFSSATTIDDTAKVVSPWSGAVLSPSAFVHACFVWFGLLNFWCLALEAESFDTAPVRRCLTRAAVGFLRGPLLDHLPKTVSEAVIPTVRQAIDNMQSRVVAVFSDCGMS
jgi:hypothetical protein